MNWPVPRFMRSSGNVPSYPTKETILPPYPGLKAHSNQGVVYIYTHYPATSSRRITWRLCKILQGETLLDPSYIWLDFLGQSGQSPHQGHPNKINADKQDNALLSWRLHIAATCWQRGQIASNVWYMVAEQWNNQSFVPATSVKETHSNSIQCRLQLYYVCNPRKSGQEVEWHEFGTEVSNSKVGAQWLGWRWLRRRGARLPITE